MFFKRFFGFLQISASNKSALRNVRRDNSKQVRSCRNKQSNKDIEKDTESVAIPVAVTRISDMHAVGITTAVDLRVSDKLRVSQSLTQRS
jgi:hypothetical protein